MSHIIKPKRYTQPNNNRIAHKRTPGGKEGLGLLYDKRTIWMPGLIDPTQYDDFFDTPGRFRDREITGTVYTTGTTIGEYPAPTTAVAQAEPLTTVRLRTQGDAWRPIAGNGSEATATHLPCLITGIGQVALIPPVTSMQLVYLPELNQEALGAVPLEVIEECGPQQPLPLFLRPYARML